MERRTFGRGRLCVVLTPHLFLPVSRPAEQTGQLTSLTPFPSLGKPPLPAGRTGQHHSATAGEKLESAHAHTVARLSAKGLRIALDLQTRLRLLVTCPPRLTRRLQHRLQTSSTTRHARVSPDCPIDRADCAHQQAQLGTPNTRSTVVWSETPTRPRLPLR